VEQRRGKGDLRRFGLYAAVNVVVKGGRDVDESAW
jgi:hypothetical protein